MRERVPYGYEEKEIRISGSPLGQAWPVLYGQLKVQCPVVHFHVRNGLQIELAVVVSLGEIESIDKVFVEDEEVYPATKSWCQLERFTGTLTQERSKLLTHASWYSALPSVAYVAMVLDASQSPSAGLPRVQVVAKGRKCGPGNTYTTNPVWMLRDLLTNSLFGAKVNVSDWTTQASQVTVPASLWVQALGAVTKEDAAIRSLLTVMHGRLYWKYGGCYLALDNQAANVGTVSPSGPIRLLEEIEVSTSMHEMPNSVKGEYVEPSTWTERQITVQTDKAAKGEERPRWLDLGALAATTYQDTVRICKTALERSRAAARVLKLVCDGTAYDCWPGTRVTVNADPLTGLEALVTRRVLSPDGTVVLEVVPWAATDFDSGTYSAPTDQDPTTTTSADLMLIRDDFTGGGTTGAGDIGELGWSGSGTFSYPAETGKVGILEFNSSGWTTLASCYPSAPYSARVVAKAVSGVPTVFTAGNLAVWHDGTYVKVGIAYPFVQLAVPYGQWFEVTLSVTQEGSQYRIRAMIRYGSTVATGEYVGALRLGVLGIYGGVGRLDYLEVVMQRL